MSDGLLLIEVEIFKSYFRSFVLSGHHTDMLDGNLEHFCHFLS